MDAHVIKVEILNVLHSGLVRFSNIGLELLAEINAKTKRIVTVLNDRCHQLPGQTQLGYITGLNSEDMDIASIKFVNSMQHLENIFQIYQKQAIRFKELLSTDTDRACGFITRKKNSLERYLNISMEEGRFQKKSTMGCNFASCQKVNKSFREKTDPIRKIVLGIHNYTYPPRLETNKDWVFRLKSIWAELQETWLEAKEIWLDAVGREYETKFWVQWETVIPPTLKLLKDLVEAIDIAVQAEKVNFLSNTITF